MRALVTGASGFVGPHLLHALAEDGWEGVACDADLGDAAALRDALDRAEPDAVFHLAAQSFVPESTRDPEQTYAVNVLGSARLFAAVRAYAASVKPTPRVLFASSAEVYGAREPAELPLRETLAPQPSNPYAASKAAAEAILIGEMHAFGGDVVIARAFNHIGPGQSERFAVASFAFGLAKIAAGGQRVLSVGNLDAERDVLDVRDIVRAYVALARHGERGEIYNVCSGKAVAMRDLLRELITIAHVPVEVRTDPQRVRPADVAITVGSNEKLVARTGWSPQIALPASLRDIYADARNRVAL
ncbi:MAG: GDP-mannose 4,6-dehydratase [Candidatus Tyrphobacter sp.]